MPVLDSRSPAVAYLCGKDKKLAKAISRTGALSYEPFSGDGFDFLARTVIDQMLSVKAGKTIYSRLSNLCGGGPVSPEAVCSLSAEELRKTGMSARKASCIRELANAVIRGDLSFERLKGLPDESVMKQLTSVKGIGSWTAKMFMIFVLDRPDVLPFEDATFLQAYKWVYGTEDVRIAAVKKRCAGWHPHASAAARFLYQAIDAGLVGTPLDAA